MLILTDPKEIEAKSFRIVNKYLTGIKLSGLEKDVMKRVLHATSDLNYINDLLFHSKAIKSALMAIRRGENVVVDASMVKAGINVRSKSLASFDDRFNPRFLCRTTLKNLKADGKIINIPLYAVSLHQQLLSNYG